MTSEELCAFLDLRAAGVVFAPGVGMLHHTVGDDDAEMERNRGQAVLKGAAVEQQCMAYGTATSDELVHDAGGGADEVILRALAQPGYFRQRDLRAGEAQDSDHAGHFDGRRGTKPSAQGHIAVEGEAEAGDLDPHFAQGGDDTHRVVAPVMRSFFGKAVERVGHLIVEVRGIDGDALVVAGANCGESRKIDRGRHDEALGIVGVLADHVDAPGSDKNGGVLPKSLRVETLGNDYIQHPKTSTEKSLQFTTKFTIQQWSQFASTISRIDRGQAFWPIRQPLR